ASGAAGQALDAAERAETAAASVESPVSYAPQTLTAEQQEQARGNIGVIDNVDSATSLRSVPAPSLYKGVRAGIPGKTYEYDTDSELLDNGVSILKPLGIDPSDPGRWVMQPGVYDESFE